MKAAHNLGHFGKTRTKQMLRSKYWFPALNAIVEEMIDSCMNCQITTKEHRKEVIKPSQIPDEPWDSVSVDFGGPFPDGHYNLVVIDKRTRYPEVEQVYSTSFRSTARKLRKIFSTHGVPRRLESDSGPPFKSEQFKDFAKEMGFEHHRITPHHPRANGEAESFMKMLNKTEQIAHSQRRESQDAIYDILMGYRSTPHPATGVSPYNALMRREIRTKLDHKPRNIQILEMEIQITTNDREYKRKWTTSGCRQKDTQHKIAPGDVVLLQQKKRNKWSTAYESEPYTIIRVDGSSIAARRASDGREVYRDATHFKLTRNFPIDKHSENWREELLGRMRTCDKSKTNQEPNNQPMVRDTDQRVERYTRRQMPEWNRRLPARYRD